MDLFGFIILLYPGEHCREYTVAEQDDDTLDLEHWDVLSFVVMSFLVIDAGIKYRHKSRG